MKLLAHQKKFLEQNPQRAILVWEAGTGKTIAAGSWLARGRDQDALVICPKRIKEKWQKELALCGTTATVVSKEEMKKMPARQWSAIVADEVDELAAPLFVAKRRSKVAEAFYNILRVNLDTPRLLLTATPVRSTPWNLHTILTYYGQFIPVNKWKEAFFSLEVRPYLPRPAWLPKPGWQKRMQPIIEKYCDVVLMRDCVGSIPEERHETIQTPTKPYPPEDESWEPAKAFAEQHKHEQKGKPPEILRIGKNYRKVLVVAHYVEQIKELEKTLSRNRQTFTVYGGTKDQEEVIREAQASEECYLIIQASLSAGFDADTFSCVVFASMSYRVRDYVQMKGRVKRIHNLHPVIYYHLHGGARDKGVYRAILAGRDFVPSEYAATSTEKE